MAERTAGVNLGRHRANCSICAHEALQEIEAAFVAWKSPAAIAEEFGLSDRANVYRHAHALQLFTKRQKNVRAALEKLIERVGEVDVTAAAVVSAIQAYTKINSAGEWVDKVATVSLNELFDKMTAAELERYAASGETPDWFRGVVGATGNIG